MSEEKIAMSSAERRASLSLAGIFGLRMLGLFLILPVLSLYAHDLAGSTPLLVGMAIGAYGLTQALLQIPFGAASDRLGRKPVIAFGLVLFAVGSAVAAAADSIYLLLLGRILQGAGAIGAAVIALVADLTREETRTRAMALIGMTIGVSFAVSLVLGPTLAHWIGVPGIFWLTAVLSVGAIGVVFLVVPEPEHSGRHRDAELSREMLGGILRDPTLLRLDFGIFALHLVLTALFVVVPPLLVEELGLTTSRQWLLYLPVVLVSFVLMFPLVFLAEARRFMQPVFVGAIVTLAAALLLLVWLPVGIWTVGLALVAFFTGFNVLEASLPSLISKAAPAAAKGTAVGVYNVAEFFGAFLGGTLGGWASGVYGPEGVFLIGAVMALVWLGVALSGPVPHHVSTRMMAVGALDQGEAQALERALRKVEGVVEARVFADEGTAYCKVDRQRLDEASLSEAMDWARAEAEAAG
ncbi:MFS transporter [Thiohalorhabdus methylotrophus]|uniref:MFS transporter n=1 Tax=Thiohalorhabdus methylotrophus TaxID=3242694 RepID=A0ABV4TRA4_9GAMM